MDDQAKLSLSSGDQSTARGATLRPFYVERNVKIYAIQEKELTTIGLFNSIFTAACSIASGVFFLAASISWDIATNPANSIAQNRGTPALVVCSLIILACCFVAYWARRSRRTELKEILDQSRTIVS